MPSIAKAVRDVVRARLQSADGLNAQFFSLYSEHGLSEPPQINWDVEARQFFEANISFDDAVATDSPTTPCVFLYCTGAQNQNRVKFRTFAGQVTAQVDVVIEVPMTRVPEQLEGYADLIEEALFRCLNGVNWSAVQGSSNVSYNGQIATERTEAAITNSSNWRQVISASITFEVTL